MKSIKIMSLLLLVAGCESTPPYEQQVLSRPIPTTQQGINAECNWVRQEMARQNVAMQQTQTNPNPMSGLVVALTQKNLATLEQRASEVGCAAAFGGGRVIIESGNNQLEQCVAVCKANTDRTSEQCFDTCLESN